MEKTVQGIMVGRDRNRYRSISPRKQYDTTQKQNDNNANIYVYKEDWIHLPSFRNNYSNGNHQIMNQQESASKKCEGWEPYEFKVCTYLDELKCFY